MAISIDATAGGANANSYVTEADALTYIEPHALNGVYTDASVDQRAAALVESTRLLDEYFDWKGSIASNTQALRWPRSDVTDPDGRTVASDSIPVFLARATAIYAAELLVQNRQTDPDGEGLSSVSVAGAVSVVFDKTFKSKAIPESVLSSLRPYGSYAQSSRVKVVRG